MSCSPASDILGTQEEESFCGPVGDVMAALDGARAMVRELFETVVDAGAEQRVGPGDLAAVVDSAARLERAVSAVGVASIAGYARRKDADDAGEGSLGVASIRACGFVDEWAAAALGHLLGVSTRTADARVTRAADLFAVMPHALTAVADGHLELWQAAGVLETLRDAGADDETVRAVDAWLSVRLAATDPTRLRSLTRYALGRIRPDLLPDTARRNRARRAITRWECEPGLSEVTARIPTEKAAAVWEAATTLAKEYVTLDPTLTLDQARCDAFVDLLLTNVTVTTHVTIGVPVATSAYAATGESPVPAPDPDDPGPAAGVSDAGRVDADRPRDETTSPARTGGGIDGAPAAMSDPGAVPDWAAHPDAGTRADDLFPRGLSHAERRWWLSGVHLRGIGYVPPDVVQALVTELGAVISTALLDSTRGTLLSYVHQGYRPSATLRHMVQLRDGRCRAFGCTRSATRCDVDHATPFDREGPTSAENLASLCRFHHRAKQQKQWRYLLDPDTGVTWWIHAVTGAMRTTVADICLGPHAWSPAPRRRPPESRGVGDRVATPTGDHPYDPGRPRGDDPVSLSGSVLARARRAIADPTIPF